MKEIVLIGCGKSKLPYASQAKDLYQGNLFRRSWLVAEKEYPKADRYILSAKHFLLDPEKTIVPYDETLNGKRVAEKRAWAQKVASQLLGKGYDLKEDRFIFFAGDDYTRYLISPNGPMENFKLQNKEYGGIGHILKGLNETLFHLTQDFQGTYLESVADLRNSLLSPQNFVRKEPGVYRLWVKEDAAKTLLNNLKTPVDIRRILKQQIQNESYRALYFGMSKNLFDRLKGHIPPHNHSTGKNVTISTLRHTLSAVLFINKSLILTENELNEWMDENFYIEWEYLPGVSLAKYIEDVELKRNYYPLNIQDNYNITTDLRKKIKDLRKEVKK